MYISEFQKSYDNSHICKYSNHQNINKANGTKMTISHKFNLKGELTNNEKNDNSPNFWRCNGQCCAREPFHGWVKREISKREPDENDNWWQKHRSLCKGEFEKVLSPHSNRSENAPAETKKKKIEGSALVNALTMINPPTTIPVISVKVKEEKTETEMKIDGDVSQAFLKTSAFWANKVAVTAAASAVAATKAAALEEYARANAETVNCPICEGKIPRGNVIEHLEGCLGLDEPEDCLKLSLF